MLPLPSSLFLSLCLHACAHVSRGVSACEHEIHIRSKGNGFKVNTRKKKTLSKRFLRTMDPYEDPNCCSELVTRSNFRN